ncbi:MAG: isochorismatase family protein [Actinomycetota bacterium]|nr:isochorismatase family protein [Actinomycetota bacterium]
MTTDYDAKTALLVVDVQNDFADPGGNLYVTEGEKVVPLVNREVDRALEAGATVVYTQDWHPESTPHFQKDGGIWPVHCVQGTWGAEFYPDLKIRGEIVQKGTGGEDGYSGFTVRHPESGEARQTGLEDLLRERAIERVVIAGLATDYCVKETALDATQKGFETRVLIDAVRAVELEAGDAERAIKDMESAGAVVE